MERTEVLQARSSGGERYLDTVEVVGSNPIVPTILRKEDERVAAGVGLPHSSLLLSNPSKVQCTAACRKRAA